MALDLLLLPSAALAAGRTTGPSPTRPHCTASKRPATPSSVSHPHIDAAGAELYTSMRERYEWAFEALISGVMATPRP